MQSPCQWRDQSPVNNEDKSPHEASIRQRRRIYEEADEQVGVEEAVRKGVIQMRRIILIRKMNGRLKT